MKAKRWQFGFSIGLLMGLLGIVGGCTPGSGSTAEVNTPIGLVSPGPGDGSDGTTFVAPTVTLGQTLQVTPTPDEYQAGIMTEMANYERTRYIEQATLAATLGYITLPPYETYAAQQTEAAEMVGTNQAVETTPIPTFEMDIPSGEYMRDPNDLAPSEGQGSELPPLVVITDPTYVRNEVFGVYQRFLEYLRFEAGPPGDDVAERLAEFMVTDEALISRADEVGGRSGAGSLKVPGLELENCAYPDVLRGLQSQRGNGQHVRTLIRNFESIGWKSVDWRLEAETGNLDIYLPENGTVGGTVFGEGFLVGLNGLTFGAFGGNSLYADFELVDSASGAVLGRIEELIFLRRRQSGYDVELYKPAGETQWRILRTNIFFCSDVYSRLVSLLENAGP